MSSAASSIADLVTIYGMHWAEFSVALRLRKPYDSRLIFWEHAPLATAMSVGMGFESMVERA